MLKKEHILHILQECKPYFQKEFGVISIGLFGSYATESNTVNSDVDIVIDLPTADYKAMLRVLDVLEKRLDRKVDLIRRGPHIRSSFLQTLEQETIYA